MGAGMLVLLASLGTVDAKITEVTVFSDRARVVRTAKVLVAGLTAVELPLVSDTVDTSTLRVEASGAEVHRVDIRTVQRSGFPQEEARRLIGELERTDDLISQTASERDVHQAIARAMGELTPQLPPAAGEASRAWPKLDAGGWMSVLAWAGDFAERLGVEVAALEAKLQELHHLRARLVREAELTGATERGGHQVIAQLKGQGNATVTMAYMIAGARWYPTYDIQYLPAQGQVRVGFAGRVSQETGEDWEEAALILSTATPAVITSLPKLLTWKIGERDRFIPTPVARSEPPRPPPPPYRPPQMPTEADRLRDRLRALAGAPPSKDNLGAALRQRSEAVEADETEAYPSTVAEYAQAEPPPMRSRASAPAAASPAKPYLREARGQSAPDPAGMSLAPPPGYRLPSFAPDLPASQAGGYALAFSSLQRETVRSGKGARQVAVFSQAWPVQVERRLFPALASEAFLVAELKSPSPHPLPGGEAHLFVGEDPAGIAKLDLVSPGQPFTLPLGLDRALKPIRNVKLVQEERGLIGKDEVGEYQVSIELANPYGFPVPIRIFDQVPVTDDPDLEVKLLSTSPTAIQSKAEGTLEWRLTMPASGKTVVKFAYTLRRPKGYRLRQ